MHRVTSVPLAFLVFLAGDSLARADDDKVLQQALALEIAAKKIISRAEPAVACIIVSRSEGYKRVGQPPSGDVPGQLGSFNTRKPLPIADKDEREQLRRKLDLSDPEHVPEAFGSGVVIDAKGLVLTNYHVVRDATKIFVRLPGKKASYANIHAADSRSDLAVLKLLDSSIMPLQTITLGDATRLERGQFILALANPHAAGFRDGQPSASWGMISNLRRRAPGQPREEERTKPLYYYGTLIQTDARISLGCSGGALLDLKGELIGLSTAFAAIHGGEATGGFAMPLDTGMRRILDVLKRGEEVEYGFLGIGFKEVGNDPAEGVVVGSVIPGSPAELEARLQPEDVIIAVNGVAVHEKDDLFVQLGTHLAGGRIKLQVRRAKGQETAAVEVTLAKFYVGGKGIASSKGQRPFVRGLRVDYTSLLVQQPPRPASIPSGVLIAEVQEETAAARAQLRPGEVITHVNDRAVNSPAAFYQTVADLKGPLDLRLFVPHGAPARVKVE